MKSVGKKDEKGMDMTECNVTVVCSGLAIVGFFSEHVWNSLLGREVARGSRCVAKEQM